jgi:predicted AlkP superfamily pyrophosphatase or phosphodiesterase
MLDRYRHRFGTGGFRRLMDQGTWYTNAHYGTSNTFTAAGHAVLVTGADTAEHGMLGNEWFDRSTGKSVYCTTDSRTVILGELAKEGAGMSPANLTATTIGDEISVASAARALVFAVAGKDRSAIIPGGHRGKAFWFSEEIGGFVTSSYYHSELPEWVAQWNLGKPIEKYRSRPWALAKGASTYRYAENAENPHARPNKTVGKTFPHSLATEKDKDFFSALRFTPMLDEYTAEFVRELARKEGLGKDATTDYLSISFSSTDYVGHTYGPNSVEYEDNLIWLDSLLEALFSFIDEQAGEGKTLIVLSADHGADDIPEERAGYHMDADRLGSRAAIRHAANIFLKARFGADNLVADYVPPGLYLNSANVLAAKLDPVVVENALAGHARRIPGVAYAMTRTSLISGSVARTPLMDRVQRGFHPERSGDVVLIQKQFWYMDSDPNRYAAMHGSPYNYDTHVPVIFYGASIPARRVGRDVEPASIAPTLAALLRISAPSGAIGPVLTEVVP